MARTDISMTPEEVDAFLAAGWNLQVATIGIDGWPHVTTLWYTIRSGLITFRSFRRSQRIVNLGRDPRLTVLVEAGDTYENLRGVMVKGHAELSDDRQEVLEVYGAVAAKYQFDGAALDPEAVETLFGARAAKNTVVTLHPDRIASWDHRKLDGAY
jgi:nitroimidazol reductase NimA-like FMN-containing flavoprotein (pyridoxamine 5'-phosphate oxidase superfamily)